jgi:transposase
MRDLTRCRAIASQEQRKARQRLHAFLLRCDRVYRGTHPWTKVHYRWLGEQRFEIPAHQVVFQSYINDVLAADDRSRHISEQIDTLVEQWAMKPVLDALRTMRGVSSIVAATVLAVTGDMRRFETPRQLMAYFGLIPSEHSSGGTIRRGGITKTGDREVRRILFQAAWAYRHTPRVSRGKTGAYADTNSAIRAIA